MCGIAGKYFFNGLQYHDYDLDGMLNSIIHRGPDSEGRYSDNRVSLGFRRLSIIDIESGDQPLFNEDGEIILIANGEIYNYMELKTFLQSKGHYFKTRSDCEVLVHLYEEFGQNFINKLNGMFAFCLYDRRQKKLLLGRDRVGIKPLYYSVQERVLIFASEIKAILEASEVELSESSLVLDEYLCFRFLSGTRTFFREIELLAAGTLLEANPEGVHITKYWEPSFLESSIYGSEAINLIQVRLQESVQRQLMSDVPLGTQLSGGVDSSWVSILGARQTPGMKSFSVSFSEAGFDETREAKEVALKGDLEYHEIMSNPVGFGKDLPHIIWHNDEPLTHANAVEIYNLCRYAKQHVKVLLTGEGADELFGGYPRYLLSRINDYYKFLPPILRPAFRYGLNWLAKSREKKPSSFLGLSSRDLVFWNAAFTLPDKVAWLMDKDELDLCSRQNLLDLLWNKEVSPMDNLLLFEFKSYLQPILLRQDKMSMGASIESRVPILDNDMVELAFRIPASEKIRMMKPKYLFKIAAARDLPSKIVYKRKIGFGVPIGPWMKRNGSLAGYLDLLNDERRNLSDISEVRLEQLIKEHKEGIKDHQDILWPLINYVIWRRIFFSKG